MEFDLENPLTPSDAEKSIAALFAAETDHMCAPLAVGVLDLSTRRHAASFILQAQLICSNLDPFVAYLAVNYLDRFLSKQQIPREKPWIARLLSISCLSLACKMRRTDFTLVDFQKEEGFIFDAHTIGRMELLILGALQWRMRSITPFAFLDFFVAFFFPDDALLLQTLKSRAACTILKAQTEVKMIDFKPSVVAAAALLTAAQELFPVHFAAFRSAISYQFINKERLSECCLAIGDVATTDGCDSSCGTPVSVLRAHHHGYSSSESEQNVGSSLARATRN